MSTSATNEPVMQSTENTPAPSSHQQRSALRIKSGPIYRSIVRALPKNRFGDRLFSRIEFMKFHKRWPSNARTYNDVLYRIKTSNDILDPLRVFVSDKEFVKLYVKATVGDQYNVPTVDVIRDRAAVDRYVFPDACCIKPTHVSGRVVLRRNGEPVDREKIKSWFDLNYYHVNREANYKLLQPKVIIEPLIFGSTNVEDYKILCSNGVPRIIQVDVDRHIQHKRKYFDANWNDLGFSIKYPRTDRTLPKPQNLTEMLEVAAALSRNFWFVRVDLYSNGSELLVGELTHCPDNADGRFSSPQAEQFVSQYLFGNAAR
jgi:hypothetical protein